MTKGVGIEEIAQVLTAEKSGELDKLRLPEFAKEQCREALNGARFLWFYLDKNCRDNCSDFFWTIYEGSEDFSYEEAGILPLALSEFLFAKDFGRFAEKMLTGEEELKATTCPGCWALQELEEMKSRVLDMKIKCREAVGLDYTWEINNVFKEEGF